MKNECMMEFQRVRKSRGFILAMLIGIIIAVVHFVNVVLPYKDFIYPPKIAYPASVFARWMGADMGSVYPTLYYFLLPILIVLPCAGSYKSDIKTGYIKQIVTRTSKNKYLSAKYLMTFLTGGITAVFPMSLNFMLTAMIFPALIPQVGTGFFSLRSFHMLGKMFYSHPYAYLLIYMLINFIFFGLLATVALSAAHICEQVLTTILVPFVLYLLVYAVAQSSRFLSLSPFYYLRPCQPAATDIEILLLEFAMLCICGGASFFIGKKRDVF